LIQKKRHRPASLKIFSAIIDNVAGNRNPGSTAIPAIIEFAAVCFAGAGTVEMGR
jgi:hypothetical protein